MKHLLLCTTATLLMSLSVDARPILSDSQKSYAAVCLDESEPPDRLIAICETALAGISDANLDTRNLQVALARAYDNAGQHGNAKQVAQDVLAQDPAHGGALNVLGWAEWALSDYAAATDAFQKALDSGASAQSFAGLASSGRYRGDMEEQEYLTLIDTALAISPDYVWAYREKAWFYIDTQRPEEAERILEHALQYDEEDPWTLYALGVAFYDQGRSGAANARLNRAIATGYAPTSAYLYRARANFDLENFRRVLIDAERVVQDWPDSSDGYVWKARALSALGLRPAGQTVLRDFLDASHDDFAAYWLSDLLYYGGEEAEAMRVLTTVFEQGNPDYYSHEFMAMMLIEAEDFAAAQTHIDGALSYDPTSAYPVFYTALIHLGEGRFDEAEDVFLDALRGGLPRHRISYFIGALTEQGELERAVAFRTRANTVSAAPE